MSVAQVTSICPSAKSVDGHNLLARDLHVNIEITFLLIER